ncbi:hypothetical protein M2280_005943 [Prescottella agglutinans]|uniref:Uncharacterized protein n=1 Tax=Prescottella agglutinans TaxID=1644129 RepID=A0ABT6MK39_9NOCA|nr:hypothetical protein [Prescottella agglutinans]
MFDWFYVPFLNDDTRGWLITLSYELWKLGFPPGYPG